MLFHGNETVAQSASIIAIASTYVIAKRALSCTNYRTVWAFKALGIVRFESEQLTNNPTHRVAFKTKCVLKHLCFKQCFKDMPFKNKIFQKL